MWAGLSCDVIEGTGYLASFDIHVVKIASTKDGQSLCRSWVL